jgi:hypothetical protein
MPDAASQEWVKRVLGIDLPGAAQGGAVKRGAPLMPIWLAAKEEVDTGIGKLQDALRQSDDEDLHAIAEFGLYGATRGQTVQLMAALTDADKSHSPEALAKVVNAVDDFRDFLDGAPIVDLIENNPFGVAVPMRQTLGAALAELARHAAT